MHRAEYVALGKARRVQPWNGASTVHERFSYVKARRAGVVKESMDITQLRPLRRNLP